MPEVEKLTGVIEVEFNKLPTTLLALGLTSAWLYL